MCLLYKWKIAKKYLNTDRISCSFEIENEIDKKIEL